MIRLNHDSGGAPSEHLIHELMGVVFDSDDRHKERAGANLSAVDERVVEALVGLATK
jgi:hypothetical protein